VGGAGGNSVEILVKKKRDQFSHASRDPESYRGRVQGEGRRKRGRDGECGNRQYISRAGASGPCCHQVGNRRKENKANLVKDRKEENNRDRRRRQGEHDLDLFRLKDGSTPGETKEGRPDLK